MKQKVKKYFMAGTDDELQFGDIIELDMVKEENGKKKHRHIECEFCPLVMDFLLKDNLIEEREVETDIIDFDEEDDLEDEELFEALENMVENQEDLERRMDAIEEKLEGIRKSIKVLQDMCKGKEIPKKK